MGTRSMIGSTDRKDTVYAAYCHYDGYFDGVGLTLHKYWTGDQFLDMISQPDFDYIASLGKDVRSTELNVGNKDNSVDVFKNGAEYQRAFKGGQDVDYIYLYDNRLKQWMGMNTRKDSAWKHLDDVFD